MSEIVTCSKCAKEAYREGFCRGHFLASKRKPKAPKPPAAIQADAFDRKLDHFRYTKSEHDLDAWEGDQTISPLHLPDDIKTKYPDMRFHWVSKARLDKRGKEYQGWQIFSDSAHPEGVRRGNDLVLAAMPEERAKRYNDFVKRESGDRMKQLQENDLEGRFKRDADVIKRMGGDVEITGTGMTVDRNVKRPRGLHPEEVRERIIKQREERAKGRVIFT